MEEIKINVPGVTSTYEILRRKALQLIFNDKDLQHREFTAAPLTPEAAIGRSSCCDYVLLKGKERLLQAEIDGFVGQAFTDRPGYYQGQLNNVFNFPLEDNFERAVFISFLNALLRRQDVIQKSMHCRDESPAHCALLLSEHIKKVFEPGKVVLIGYQPRFAETLADSFALRINDLDPDNLGKTIKGAAGVSIESSAASEENMEWGDLVVVTGSSIINNTFPSFHLSNKPVLFFGTSIAVPAQVLGLNHFCPLSF